MNGIYLHKHQLTSILKRKKSLLVKTSDIDQYIGQEIFLLSKNKIYATARLKKFKTVNGTEFDTYFNKHRITSDQRKKWWGNIDVFHLYTIDVKKSFNPQLFWKMIENPPTIVENVEVELAIDMKMPITQITPERILSLTENEKKHIYRQIETVTKYSDEAEKMLLQKVIRSLEPEPEYKPYILQMRFINIDPIDIESGIDDLKNKFYDHVYDLRLQRSENVLMGWTLYGNDMNVQKMRAERKGRHDVQLWKNIAEQKSYSVKMDDGTYIKYFTVELGEYAETKINNNAYQYIFRGTALHGNFICSKRLRSNKWGMERLLG